MPDKTFDLAGLEFIELNKLLKLLRLVNSGGEANQFIDQGNVFVNGVAETRRRRKLRKYDVVSIQNTSIQVI